MITKQEIMDFSKEFNRRPDIIEKDYVLGWLLAGIAAHPELHDAWVFKGGTCLKKCYFETFRFSEDLDFTLKEEAHKRMTIFYSIVFNKFLIGYLITLG
jgi:predicted nucleotidyltransferase component of viral defense system